MWRESPLDNSLHQKKLIRRERKRWHLKRLTSWKREKNPPVFFSSRKSKNKPRKSPLPKTISKSWPHSLTTLSNLFPHSKEATSPWTRSLPWSPKFFTHLKSPNRSYPTLRLPLMRITKEDLPYRSKTTRKPTIYGRRWPMWMIYRHLWSCILSSLRVVSTCRQVRMTMDSVAFLGREHCWKKYPISILIGHFPTVALVRRSIMLKSMNWLLEPFWRRGKSGKRFWEFSQLIQPLYLTTSDAAFLCSIAQNKHWAILRWVQRSWFPSSVNSIKGPKLPVRTPTFAIRPFSQMFHSSENYGRCSKRIHLVKRRKRRKRMARKNDSLQESESLLILTQYLYHFIFYLLSR